MPSHAKQQPPQQRHPLALTVTPDVGGSNSNSAERIEWSRHTILSFIEDYRRQRVLWDPNTKGYHIKQIKYEALKLLGHKYGTEIRSIRSKIKSLRSSFHREHGKVINGQRHGIHYQPMWFAYEAIRFILDGEQQQQQQQQPRVLLERGAAKRAAAHNSAALEGVDDDEDEECDDDDVDDGDCEGEGDGGVVVERVAVTAELTAAHAEHADCEVGETQVKAPAAMKQRHNASGSSNNNRHSKNNNNKHNVVAAAVVGGGAGAGSSDDERDVKRSDSDTDMSHFGNIISAEDVKTELIESDTQDLHKSPLAYLALTPTRVSTSSAKKRKRTPQPDDLSVTAASHHQHHNQQYKHESAMPAKFSHNSSSRAQEPSSTTTAAAATTSGSSQKQQQHNSFSAAGQTDEYGVFGEYVAITIRKLKTSKAKIVVKHLINNLLYEAELGKYDYGIPSSKEPPQLYKTT